MRKPVRIRNVFHHIRHGFAVPPSPQGEGFFLRILTDGPRALTERRPYIFFVSRNMTAAGEGICHKSGKWVAKVE